MTRILSILAFLIFSATALLAQPEDESPYSSSTVDRPAGDWFATNGFVIICAVIFFGLMVFLFLRGRKRA
ncbi:hypothetical protein [Neolewinella sp.]|uniref:hypothetical protein n=1 Tax=Neolewinella sp. TaxID=2993543 RepID=UPI003B51702D